MDKVKVDYKAAERWTTARARAQSKYQECLQIVCALLASGHNDITSKVIAWDLTEGIYNEGQKRLKEWVKEWESS
jgi:hypothetical protein